MEPLVAAVILAWVVIVLLAFAMAGILHQLRAVQAALARQSAAGGIAPVTLPDAVKPQGGRAVSALLLVDESCGTCATVFPVFAGMVAGAPDVDFALLSRKPVGKLAAAGVRTIVDNDVYHVLDPGWQPALVIVGRDGDVLAAEPAGSAEALRAGLGTVTHEIAV